MVESAKLNGLIPYKYFEYILENCRGKKTLTEEEVEKFLPWSKDLPDYIKKSATAE